jgi:hypothetical protein
MVICGHFEIQIVAGFVQMQYSFTCKEVKDAAFTPVFNPGADRFYMKRIAVKRTTDVFENDHQYSAY